MWQPDLEYFAWVYLSSDGFLYGFCIMWFPVANLIHHGSLQIIYMTIYTLFDGLAYNMCGYFASCVGFFRAPRGRGKIQAMSKMSARIIC